MPWFKVDDAFHSHPKVRSCGYAAIGLWVVCGSYCASYMTDGFIPETYIKMTGNNGTRLAAKLVSAGLWYPDERDGETGWSFHDWDHFQPSKSQVEAARKRDRLRKEAMRLSARNPSGVPTESDISLIPAHPIPSRPSSNGHLGGVSNVSSGAPTPCPKHPDGPNHNQPCRNCQRTRQAAEANQTARTEALRAFWADVESCKACTPKGWTETVNGAVRCQHHDWSVIA
jgi:hypothetical protein